MDCVATRDVLDIDDLLLRFRQCVGLKPTNGFEVIPECTRSGLEPTRVVCIDALPPQIKKYQPIVQCRQTLLNCALKRTRGEVFRIFGEPEIGIGTEPGGGGCNIFAESQQSVEEWRRHGRTALSPCSFQSRHA